MIGNLNSIKTGYCINGNIINNLCYADDTTLFSPSLSGLQLLIDCCQKFANSNKITYNIEKSYQFIITNLIIIQLSYVLEIHA